MFDDLAAEIAFLNLDAHKPATPRAEADGALYGRRRCGNRPCCVIGKS